MKAETFSHALGQIDEHYIAEAAAYTAPKKGRWDGWLLPVAACVIVLCLLFGLPRPSITPLPPPDTVTYEDVQFYDGQVSPELLALGGSGTADVASFSEAMLSECSAIVEGTVTNAYVKEYTYDVYYEKFASGILHERQTTVVYELQVERVWFGPDVEGQTLVIEDRYFPTVGMCFLKTGGRYVVPLCEEGETLPLNDPLADGDVTREGVYTSLYPFRPQIEVTRDGEYLVTADWKTLRAGGARRVEGGTWEQYLVEGTTFSAQMTQLIGEMCTTES